MPVLLPHDHPARSNVPLAEPTSVALKIGIINIMPRLEAYEPLLLRRLASSGSAVEPVFIRLESHAYTSSDRAHLERFYRTFVQAGHLDGLVLTGAPVEEVDFVDVRYWRELTTILDRARHEVRSTLGICWGGLALGAMLDIPKRPFRQKLFGVFEERVLLDDDPLVPRSAGPTVRCAQSRHSGNDDALLEQAAERGRVRLLTHSPKVGYSVFASPDHRFVAHLGHPEYEADRLVFEWERDRKAGRDDVPSPHGLDLEHPTTTWRRDSEAFFARWLTLVGRADGSATL